MTNEDIGLLLRALREQMEAQITTPPVGLAPEDEDPYKALSVALYDNFLTAFCMIDGALRFVATEAYEEAAKAECEGCRDGVPLTTFHETLLHERGAHDHYPCAVPKIRALIDSLLQETASTA